MIKYWMIGVSGDPFDLEVPEHAEIKRTLPATGRHQLVIRWVAEGEEVVYEINLDNVILLRRIGPAADEGGG